VIAVRGWFVLIAAFAAGCGDDDCCTMKPADAAADMVLDAVPGGHLHVVIDRVTLPASNTEARMLALDLNGDATVDNNLGMIIASFRGMGLDSRPAMDKLVDTGATILLGDVVAPMFPSSMTATFALYEGESPMPPACSSAQDTTCRHHLTGSGSFSLASLPVDPPLSGTLINGELVAGPGHATITLVIADSLPFTVTLLGARVQLTATFGSPTTATGRLGGAISKADIDTVVIPAMRDGFEATVMRECTMLSSPPGCGCPQDSHAGTLLAIFETTPQDCSISLAEVQNNALFMSLFAPDVGVEATQALSVGVGIHAVTAAFTDPQ
jgi:hypothetical protein